MSDDNFCFACSPDNPRGLKLKFRMDGEWLKTEFKTTRFYEGYNGILHGGITSTLLDETMARLLIEKGVKAVSVKLEVSYKDKIKIGERVKIKARLLERKRRIYFLEAFVNNSQGDLKASSKGIFQKLRE